MNYQILESDFKDIWQTLNGLTTDPTLPTCALKCHSAKVGRKGRLYVKAQFIEGLDRFFRGQELQVAGNASKTVQYISTSIADSQSMDDRNLVVVLVEPKNCEDADLSDVYLVGFDSVD